MEVEDGAKLDITRGLSIWWEQDVEKAAAEIAPQVLIDPISFDAAGLIVSDEINRTGMVPSALRSWAAGVITGEIKRPIVKGKIPGATEARDKLICRLLFELVHTLGLKPTSSNRAKGRSACHAVAEAFALLGLEPKSYQAIVKIWENRDNLKGFSTGDD